MTFGYIVKFSTLDEVGGSEIDSRSPDTNGSDIGAGAAGATLLGLANFFLATLLVVFLVAGGALAGALRRADFAAFFTTFLALLDFFAGRPFFFSGLLFPTVRFAFASGRFFALLFFFAMISVLLAVLRLLAVRVAPKKSAVICA